MSKSDWKSKRKRLSPLVVVRFLSVEISVLRNSIDDEGAVSCVERMSLWVTWLLKYHRRAVGISGGKGKGEERKEEDTQK